MATLSKHGLKQTARRSGLGKNKSLALVEAACKHGIPREETTGNLRRFLDRQFYGHELHYLLTHNGNVFILSKKDGELITMFPLPGRLKHKKLKAKDGVPDGQKEASDMPPVLEGEPPCDG